MQKTGLYKNGCEYGKQVCMHPGRCLLQSLQHYAHQRPCRSDRKQITTCLATCSYPVHKKLHTGKHILHSHIAERRLLITVRATCMLIELAQAECSVLGTHNVQAHSSQGYTTKKQHTTWQNLQSSSTLAGILVGVANLQVSQSLHCSWAPTIL